MLNLGVCGTASNNPNPTHSASGIYAKQKGERKGERKTN
jgi:hypothetical protein